MKKYMHGFTLAEVLITLGIIGIVAALTIPQLIKNYEKKVLHTQFLKVYSDLNNASKLFEIHEGLSLQEYSKGKSIPKDTASKNSYESTDTLKRFMKYFKVNNKVTNSIYGSQEDGELRKDVYKRILGYIPQTLSGTDGLSQPCDESAIMTDATGRFFTMDNDLVSQYKDVKIGPKICVDTNGKKGPNKYGYDWFTFAFTENGYLIPYIGDNLSGYGDDLEDPSTYCSYEQTEITYTCAYFALQDKSPDDNGDYWNDFLR